MKPTAIKMDRGNCELERYTEKPGQAFYPPIVLKIYGGLRGRTSSVIYTFDGCFKNFDEVPLEHTGIYDSSRILQERYEEAKRALIQIEYPDRLPKGCINGPMANLLPLLVSVLYNDRPVKVLDFGGGFGLGYFDCVKMLEKSCGYEFHVVEMKQVCGKGAELFRDCGNIFFYDSLPDRKLRFDIINIGSVLQYIVDYKSKIVELCALNARFFLMTNHYMCVGADTYATRQINMPDTDSAYWILSYDEIVNIMDSNGYRLIYKSTDYQGHKFKNVPENKIVESSCNLLFSLK